METGDRLESRSHNRGDEVERFLKDHD